jgi:hypothetical protein
MRREGVLKTHEGGYGKFKGVGLGVCGSVGVRVGAVGESQVAQ